MSDSSDTLVETTRGSGNVFRDFGEADADVLQAKAILAAAIVGVLDDEELSTRAAQERTRIDHGDFSRIRRARLERFTIDRLVTILNRLDRRVDFTIELATPERAPVPAGNIDS